MTENVQEYALSHKWILWFHHVNDKNWNEESYQKLYEIENLKDYWMLMNTVPNVTSGMFFVMREDVFPRWEDINNLEGGYWTFRVAKKDSNKIWQELFSTLIGNTLTKKSDKMDGINGISISPKINNCIIKIWNNNFNSNDVNILVDDVTGINLKEAFYKKHQEQADFEGKK